MAKINAIKAVLNGMANKPPVAVVAENNDDVKTPQKKKLPKFVTNSVTSYQPLLKAKTTVLFPISLSLCSSNKVLCGFLTF